MSISNEIYRFERLMYIKYQTTYQVIPEIEKIGPLDSPR